MIKFYTLALLLLCGLGSFEQNNNFRNLPSKSYNKPVNLTGQWTGSFVDNSSSFVGFGGDRIDYVLELNFNRDQVSGYSYTYFTEGLNRYYTICKVKGTYIAQTGDVVVTEIERTKFNTPPTFRNCFQQHRLKYAKTEDTENLQGTWIAAPNQEGDCGYGSTILSRRVLKKLNTRKAPDTESAVVKTNPIFRDMNKTPAKPPVAHSKPVIKSQSPKTTATKPPVAKVQPKTIKPKTTAPVIKDPALARNDIPNISSTPDIKPQIRVEEKALIGKYEKRSKDIIETINIHSDNFTADFYDNGEIDGDSISVFYNGRLILSHQMLSDKKIRLTLKPEREVNELIMYADNLGSIPPNTALMVVNDGEKRYEVHITSDTIKSGTIIFTHK